MSTATDTQIVITGGAGLVGQNLVVQLLEAGYRRITAIDKSRPNLAVLSSLHPEVSAVEADLSQAGDWCALLSTADVVVSLHAQIGGLREEEFRRNNVDATLRLLEAMADNRDCYLVQVSSSVVNSEADDYYTRSKLAQERMVTNSPHPWLVLRPTLMFGWFDRKHFGWLSRFMARSPIFPVPGDGRYLRQPLYAGDFCSIILSAIQHRPAGLCLNISGKEKVDYIDIVRHIKRLSGSRSLILPIPRGLFRILLRIYACFDRNPPFTVSQLDALVIDETFEDVDWESRFGVSATPLAEALQATLTHPRYSQVALEF